MRHAAQKQAINTTVLISYKKVKKEKQIHFILQIVVPEHLCSSRLLYLVAICVLLAADVSAAVTGLASALQEQQLLSLSSPSRRLFDCTASYFTLILACFFFSSVFRDEKPSAVNPGRHGTMRARVLSVTALHQLSWLLKQTCLCSSDIWPRGILNLSAAAW